MNNTDNINYLHQVNAIGVIGHDFAVDAPFLTDPVSLNPIEYLKLPIEIVNFKSFDALDNQNKAFIFEQVSQLFAMSQASYAQYQQEYFYPNILTPDNCSNPILYNQYGLFTKKPIPQYQVLGFYSGIYATSYEDLEYLMEKYDYLTLGRYGNACQAEGIPVICGHHNGNYMTIINDYRPFKWHEQTLDALETLKKQKYNTNSIIAKSGDYYFVAYVASVDITQNTELSTDYGDGYWQREQDFLKSQILPLKY